MEPVRVDSTAFPAEPRTCGRCGREAPMRFPGVCGACAEALRAAAATGERREVASEYVPKVNVTANAVALKDD